MADIKVQRFEVDVPVGISTQTINAVISLSNAFVRVINSTIKHSAGQIGSTTSTTMTPNVVGVSAQLRDITTIEFNRNAEFGVGGDAKVFVEVWEYTGAVGGAYEFVVRQRGNLTLNDLDTEATAAVAGMINRNDCIPFYQGYVTNLDNGSFYVSATLGVHINSSNQISMARGLGRNSYFVTGYYAVVQFTGSAWTVHHASDANHDTMGTAGLQLKLTSNSDGIGTPFTSLTSWGSTIIADSSMVGDVGGESGIADCQLIVEPDATTSGVYIRFADNSARNDSRAYVHLLECDDLVVNRFLNSNLQEGNNTFGTPITVAGANPATPLYELGLEWFVSTTGTGTAWARGSLGAWITGYQTVNHWVHRNGNNVYVSGGIIDFSALVDTPAPTRNRIFLIA